MKRKLSLIWGIFILLILISSVYPQGTSHIVYGTIQREEGISVPEACLYFQAFILDRPTVILDQDSPYFVYNEATGFWSINLADILWNPGEVLFVEFSDSCWMEIGSVAGRLSATPEDNLGPLTLHPIAGLRPVLTEPDVTPDAGPVTTFFDFTVTYSSIPWNKAPVVVEVRINGFLYPLAAVDPFDVDYTDGANYQVQVDGADLGKGTYDFYFYAEDTDGYPAFSAVNTFTINNTPPTAPDIAIEPDMPFTDEDLTCVIITDGTDIDAGDVVSYTYEWFKNGVFQEGLTATIIPAAITTIGDVWMVVATSFDDEDLGGSDTAVTTVIAPVLSDGRVNPATGDLTTEFVYQVTYWNARNIAPGPIMVQNNFGWYDMTQVDPGDLDYTDGALFEYRTNLGEFGYYFYRFEGEDVAGHEAIGDTGIHAGPSVENDLPFITAIWVDPVLGYENTEFEVFATAEDPNGDPVAFFYQWYNQMSIIDGATEATINGEFFDKHDTLYCIVTPFDGYGTGAPMRSPEVPVLNSAPLIGEVNITVDPEGEATELSILTVVVTGEFDADGDEITFIYQWFNQDGAIPGATWSSIDGDCFDKWDTLYCQVTPYDRENWGAMLETEQIPIVNTPPAITFAYLEVEGEREATEFSTIFARVDELIDPDDDPFEYTYEWFVNDVPLGLDPSVNSIDGEYFNRGDCIYCFVTPFDLEDYGAGDFTDTLCIVNLPPYITSISIFPGVPFTDDDLQCNVTFGDDDPLDDLTVTYTWYRDGELYDDVLGAIVSADLTSSWEVWVCWVEVSDGDAAVMESVAVMINNTPPRIQPVDDSVAVEHTPYFTHVRVVDPDRDRHVFRLLEAPEGMVIDPTTGWLSWVNPHGDRRVYFVGIAVSDGYVEDSLWYLLTLVHWDDPVLAPYHLNAHSGFLAVIPLDWQQPDIFGFITDAVSLDFQHYEVFRSTSTDMDSYELLTTTYLPQYTDTDVDPGVVYFYMVRAVYSTGVSEFSNMDYASAASEGAAIWSPFTEEPGPVMDGVINPGEWHGCNIIPFIDDERMLAHLYIKHTRENLFIGLINYNDTDLNDGDQLIVSLDDNFNENWPIASPSDEGEYRLRQTDGGPSATFQAIWGTYPYGIGRDARHHTPAVFGGIGVSEDGYLVYEMRISLTDDPDFWEAILAAPGDYVGFRFGLYNAGFAMWNMVWPEGSDPENPVSFGDLLLQEIVPSPSIVVSPRGFDVYLPQGEMLTEELFIGNDGEGGLVFNITENYTPFPVEDDRTMMETSANVIVLRDAFSLVPIALTYLGYSFQDYTDYSMFLDAFEAGDWDLVLINVADANLPRLWDTMEAFVREGGRVIISTPDLDAAADHTIWEALGVQVDDDLNGRPSAVTWEYPDHPVFNIPEEIMPISRIAGDFDDYGDNLLTTNGISLATFDLYPYFSNAAIVLNEEGNVIINSFVLSQYINEDGDDLADCVELLVNEILFLVRNMDIPWLSVDPYDGGVPNFSSTTVGVTFDATELPEGGYFGYLIVESNDPRARFITIPCNLTVGPVEYDTLRLAFPQDIINVGRGDIFEVPIFINFCADYGIDSMRLVVNCADLVLSLTDVRSEIGDVTILDATTYSVEFTVTHETPFVGGAVLVWVEFTVDPTAMVGNVSPIYIREFGLNPEAEVDEIILLSGQVAIISRETDWMVALVLTVDEDVSDTVWIGINPAATNMFDDGIDMVSDEEGGYDAFSDISLWDTLFTQLDVDIRQSDDELVTWYINTGEIEGKAEWYFSEGDTLSEMGTIFLNGVFDMKNVNVYDFSAGEVLEISYQMTALMPYVFHFDPGYNMMSLPIYMPSLNIADMFPDYIDAWSYDPVANRWVSVTTMEYGYGYLILFFEEHDYTFWSYPIYEYTLNMPVGWSIIGAVYDEVDFTNPDETPDGAILPGTYYYSAIDRAYIASDFLTPGHGYFVAAQTACELHVVAGHDGLGKVTPDENPALPEWEIEFDVVSGDQTSKLAIGAGDQSSFELLPPPVPNSAYCAYLIDGGWFLSEDISALEEEMTWELYVNAGATVSWEQADIPTTYDVILQVGSEKYNLVSASSVQIKEPGIYRLSATRKNIPNSFSLHQNYPNPFNAYTCLNYDLPEDAHVKISVYDILGDKVLDIIDAYQTAGYQKAFWDGTNTYGETVSSGVYFYRIETEKFVSTKKMILMK